MRRLNALAATALLAIGCAPEYLMPFEFGDPPEGEDSPSTPAEPEPEPDPDAPPNEEAPDGPPTASSFHTCQSPGAAPVTFPAPPVESRFVSALCPAPVAPRAPLWVGAATLALPEGAASSARALAIGNGLAAHWKVGEDHRVALLDPETGAWEPEVLTLSAPGLLQAVAPTCDGVALTLATGWGVVDRPQVNVHHLRPGAPVVSAVVSGPVEDELLQRADAGLVDGGFLVSMSLHTMEDCQKEESWTLVDLASMQPLLVERGRTVRLGLDQVFGRFDGAPAAVATVERQPARLTHARPGTLTALETGPSGKATLSDRSAYAVNLWADGLAFTRTSPGEAQFRREIPVWGDAPGQQQGIRSLVMSPDGVVFILVETRPDRRLRLIQTDSNGNRRAPDVFADGRDLGSPTLVAWAGGVVLSAGQADGLSVEDWTTAFADHGPESPCMTNRPGACGLGRFEPVVDGFTCVVPEAANEVCNFADDDCDGQVDEGPAVCDFRWSGPAVHPKPPLACPTDHVPWPGILWPSNPNPDLCAADVHQRPCRVDGRTYAYDAEGRQLTADSGDLEWVDGRISRWGERELIYDLVGQLVALESDGVEVERFEYDAQGRLARWITPDREMTYRWSADGRELQAGPLSYGAFVDFEVTLRFEDGHFVSMLQDQACCASYRTSVSPPSDGVACGAEVAFLAHDDAFSSELHSSSTTSLVTDAAGRRVATVESMRETVSNRPDPVRVDERSQTHWRRDELGRPTSRLTFSDRPVPRDCDASGPPATTRTAQILYVCDDEDP